MHLRADDIALVDQLRLLETIPIESARQGEKNGVRFKLREGVTLHLYTSSQPCGNASLKRWAKGGRETFRSEVPASRWAQDEHARLLVHARHEGQVPAGALTQRRRSLCAMPVYCNRPPVVWLEYCDVVQPSPPEPSPSATC
jgi:hypothetical protein